MADLSPLSGLEWVAYTSDQLSRVSAADIETVDRINRDLMLARSAPGTVLPAKYLARAGAALDRLPVVPRKASLPQRLDAAARSLKEP